MRTEFGLPRAPLSALRGGDAASNAAALLRLLEGEPGAYRDTVILNAAGALMVAGAVPHLDRRDRRRRGIHRSWPGRCRA